MHVRTYVECLASLLHMSREVHHPYSILLSNVSTITCNHCELQFAEYHNLQIISQCASYLVRASEVLYRLTWCTGTEFSVHTVHMYVIHQYDNVITRSVY